MNGVNFTTLDLDGSGTSNRSDFAAHPHRLKNILVGLGKVQKIKENLRKISLKDCGLSKSDVELMLTESGLETVEVCGI